ncbi:hypothetical protein IGI04_001185 [Brassica rapa subsp. trilocularis]|uniref:Uncharacterized protein n=1 Tax=Brassica rapa subsp. trilocularis TaxID=1813537 RepID=A0ABQ7NRX2_BRACM|nr:hypothetical protein IGI04_001185 [Brassica rapa subsp. trilocularis]
MLLPMLHGNESGYVEAEAYRSVEARFLKKLGSGYVLEAESFRSVLEARFRKLPQGSDSDSGSEAGSERPMKLPCNVGCYNIIRQNSH